MVRYKRLIVQTMLTVTIAVHTFSLGMLWFMSHQQVRYVHAEPVLAAQTIPKQAVYGTPVQIIIPSITVNLPVDPGVYDPSTDSWTLSGYHAHYATITTPANDTEGNTFIYGHNNPYVFGPLKRIQPGAQVEVVASNGNRFFYTYQKSYTVAPNDVSLFKYHGSPILTVQTCTGAWHEKRQLYEFRLDSVIESKNELLAKDTSRRQATLQAIGNQIPTNISPGILP